MTTAKKPVEKTEETEQLPVTEKRCPVLAVGPTGMTRLYDEEGVVCGSWDNKEPKRHVWDQVARKVGGYDVDVGVMNVKGRLPDVCPEGEILEIGPVSSRVPQPAVKQKGGPTTSYTTGTGPIESLG